MSHPFFFIKFCLLLSQVYSLSSSQLSSTSSQWSSTSPSSSDNLAALHPPPAQQPSWWKLIWHRKEKLFLVHKIGGHGRDHRDKEMEDKLDIKVKINFAGPQGSVGGVRKSAVSEFRLDQPAVPLRRCRCRCRQSAVPLRHPAPAPSPVLTADSENS